MLLYISALVAVITIHNLRIFFSDGSSMTYPSCLNLHVKEAPLAAAPAEDRHTDEGDLVPHHLQQG